MLPTTVTGANYTSGARTLPQVSASASRAKDGALHLSVANLHATLAAPLLCPFQGWTPRRASGRVLTADAINAHNTFDQPDRVRPVALDVVTVVDGQVRVVLPPRSVAVLELE